MTIEEFTNKINEKKVTVVDFYATWCGPCKVLSPVVDTIADTDPDITVFKLDIEENNVLCDEFGIRSVPTLLFFKDGELEDMTVGNVPKNEILEKINTLKA